MGGIGKIVKSVASIALKVAPMLIPGGQIFGMAQSLFGVGGQLFAGLKKIAPKLFQGLDAKLNAFKGLAEKAMGKASEFLGRVGAAGNEAAAAMTKAAQPVAQGGLAGMIPTNLFAWLK
jgi:hypothetical protein